MSRKLDGKQKIRFWILIQWIVIENLWRLRKYFKYIIGSWKEDCRNGHGKLYENEKLKYVGNFTNDEPDGTGSEFYSDGSKFIGFK